MIENATEEELNNWSSDDLNDDEYPLVKDIIKDFEPESPYDNGWGLRVEFVDTNYDQILEVIIMIIERKYVSFYRLSLNGPKAKAIFEDTIKSNIKDPQAAQYLIDHHYSCGTMVYGATMDYCIPRFDLIKEGFEELDKIEPYDNGWNVTDTTRVKIVDEGENYIELHFVKVFDGEEFIIKADRIYNE